MDEDPFEIAKGEVRPAGVPQDGAHRVRPGDRGSYDWRYARAYWKARSDGLPIPEAVKVAKKASGLVVE